jgi:PAS domain S-box-containing protein
MPGTRTQGAIEKDALVRLLFDNSSDLMHVVGADGRFKLVNPAWTRLTGWTEQELIGAPALDFVVSDNMDFTASRLAAITAGEVSESQNQIRAKDGRLFWAAIRTQMIGNGDFIVTLRDATAERARDEELEDARRTRKVLGASAGLGLWEYDPQADTIWWSEELADLIGFDPEITWTPDVFFQRVHPRDRKATREVMAQAVETGTPVQTEHRVWARDRWMTMRATVRADVRRDGGFALKGISEDITELAEARDAARRGEQQMRKARREIQVNARRLKLALEAAEAGVYEIDHVGRTFWCSPEFKRVTGIGAATYEQATELQFPGFHPDDHPHVRESLRVLSLDGRRSGHWFEARIIRPDGEIRWVRCHHHLRLTADGRRMKAVGLLQDCDAGKRQEIALKEAQRAAEEAAEAKAAFLANMSHEIRTPMNGVMGVLHLLKSEALSDEGRSLLHEALSCGQMLSELLNDVIDFSKIEAGHLELAVEPLDASALVAGVVQLLRPQADTKSLQLVVDTEPGIGWVEADPVRLRQALFNLLGNAVKFTERGHVTIRCRRIDAGALRFEIEDTGIGISKAAQSHLFQRFHQADASTTRRFGGSGLGLAITQRLAQLMGGEVSFRSEEGQGSTFWLEIAAPVAKAAVQAPDAAGDILAGVRVLVVEDNATNRLIATKLLENLGASVETAEDGYLGVEAAGHGGFDLILMDVQMPGIDGVEATRRIRAMGGDTAATPIIALTANVLAHQRRAYLDAGMDGVVGKPIMPETLLAEIARVVADQTEPQAITDAA